MRPAPRFVLYTAVLPAYRRICLELIDEQLGPTWGAFAGDQHLDRTVRTDIPRRLYTPLVNHHWCGRRLLFQSGHWREAVAASTAILDLNPRSLTAWCLLLARRVLRRRTLLWGHLDPRKGPGAPTARLRAAMRDLADGCIVYTYDSARRLPKAGATARIWVAPNSLYARDCLNVSGEKERHLILYAGRLEPAKKPMLLLKGFAAIASAKPDWDLVFVGDGSLRRELESTATNMGLEGRVQFLGEIYDLEVLTAIYAEARCSVSPGFVGLTLTQSLGFGVPMVIADDEPHAPEIELARSNAAIFFRHDSVTSLAAALQSPELDLTLPERRDLVEQVKSAYSAEAMAQGLIDAFRGVPQKTTLEDGVPCPVA